MRLVKNERSILFVSVLSILAIFLGGRTTSVEGYPMMLEVEEDDERVSLSGRVLLTSARRVIVISKGFCQKTHFVPSHN